MGINLIRYRSCLLMAALSAVSVFGFAGCSGHQEKDNWSPGVPVATVETEQGKSTWPLMPVSNAIIAADARIEFPGDGIKDLRVVSLCRTAAQRSLVDGESEWIGQDTNVVEIRNLLPNSIWKRLDFHALGEVSCNFQFQVRNSRGSSWAFTLQAVSIGGLEKLANFRADEMKDSPAIASDYDLICDHFSNAVKGVKDKPAREVYKSLIYDPTLNEHAKLSRHRYNHQTCRLAIETFDVRSNKQRFLSEPFIEPFFGPNLEISANLSFAGSLFWMSGERATVLDVRIKNPSPAHVAVRLYNVQANNLLVQNFSRTSPDFYQVVEEYPVTLNYSWSGQSNVIPEVVGPINNRILEIPPGGTLQVTATVSTNMACWFDRQTTDYMRWQLPYPNVRIPVGYAYAFAGRKFMERLLNWDPAAPEFGSPTEDLELLDSTKTTDDQGVYPGRSILGHWAASTMPQNVKVVRTKFPDRSYCNVPNDGFGFTLGRVR